MNRRSQPELEKIVAKVTKLARQRVAEEQIALVESFIRCYYQDSALEDLRRRDVGDLYGAALAHWNFLFQRKDGGHKLHIYNPRLEQHGWNSGHSVIDLVVADMPFLVDSMRLALTRLGVNIHLIVHPVMGLRRDDAGQVVEVLDAREPSDDDCRESVMHFEVDRQPNEAELDRIQVELDTTLADVEAAVMDWGVMRAKVREVFEQMEATPPNIPAGEFEEAKAYLQWIEDHHFTMLGYRQYALSREGGEDVLRSVGGSGLGVLRDDGQDRVSESFANLPPEIRRLARDPCPLLITRGNTLSRVHRPGYMDYIGVKYYDGQGEVVGEHRFLGHYASAAFNRSPRFIPMLRQKLSKVVAAAGYREHSHDGKALLHILETFPRELLFEVNDRELFDTAMGILHLQERQQVRLFVHRDTYGRYFSCLVYIPRDRFNTVVRRAINDILADAFGGESSDFHVQLSESVLARVIYTIRVPAGSQPDYQVEAIERQLDEVTRTWRDDLQSALLDQHGEERGLRLFRRYGPAFRAGYREHYPARLAVHDVGKMESLRESADSLEMLLFRPLEATDGLMRFKLFRRREPIPLSDVLPMLENMGLKVVDERPSKLKPVKQRRIWMHDFGLQHTEENLDLDRVRDLFMDAFARIWHGEVENDGFNRLVLRARLHWREIVILRACCKYLRQARFTFSQEYMEQALADNAAIAKMLISLFHLRFDPAGEKGDTTAVEETVARIEQALDAVPNLDEDRILRGFLGMIQATLRTNYYQGVAEGKEKSYLSFKFDPEKVPDLPEPRPKFEIFVYSPRVEGVHLRGGSVARGGLRWSDRREDFRTEILGLVKAQMVKNAVIVPVGSKGGFVCKALPGGDDREVMMAEVVNCYTTFISGLLDLTDNLSGGEVVPPLDVVRYDSDDPYLVVAADKGTATFSDIANGVAKSYGFWLSDAFASGGSVGYDHKKMGITARGAWESVKRHFREMDVDIQSTDFTVMGIGDMSGDVFGNGMLLSRHIKLLAAFNHLHIFLDPDPDPEVSFKERERLFALPRSTWADYDAALISKGGGVYPRSAKSVPISPQVKKQLGVDADVLTPNALISALLRAPVDLLWNGGIGTYVKAADEQHSDAGDRANDSVRVDAGELRCKVVGEGGNLGVTQLARIEFARNGGCINSDAIDNSGGVECSDHEVNIKILLNAVVEAGDMTEKQRNKLLADMTDEVAQLVLRSNYLQTQALSLTTLQAVSMLDVHGRLMRDMERAGRLVREIEFLPTDERVFELKTAGEGLTTPELAVLMAYVKIQVFEELLASDLPDAGCLQRDLETYFPTPLRKRYRRGMTAHRLGREIVSTVVANEMVNRAGVTFVFRLREETGAETPDIARAFAVGREVFYMGDLWDEVESLDNQVSAQVQLQMLLEGRKILERSARWLLRNCSRPLEIDATVECFKSDVARLGEVLVELLRDTDRVACEERAQYFMEQGVSESLSRRVATFLPMSSTLDIAQVARAAEMDVLEVAGVYFALGARLELPWLRDQIVALPRDNRWQALARSALRDELYSQHAGLTAEVLRAGGKVDDAETCVDAWEQASHSAVVRCQQVMNDLRSGGTPDFAMLSVAMREVRGLRRLQSASTPEEARKKSAGKRRRGTA